MAPGTQPLPAQWPIGRGLRQQVSEFHSCICWCLPMAESKQKSEDERKWVTDTRAVGLPRSEQGRQEQSGSRDGTQRVTSQSLIFVPVPSPATFSFSHYSHLPLPNPQGLGQTPGVILSNERFSGTCGHWFMLITSEDLLSQWQWSLQV